jgi:hypothetical protein
MSDLEKISRLRHIMCIQAVHLERGTSRGVAKTQSASLQLTSGDGRSTYLEYAGDPSRNDHSYLAPTRQYRGHDDRGGYPRSRKFAGYDLHDFISALDVPELRDEFISAVAKIARKAGHIKTAALDVRLSKNPDGKKVTKTRERWSGNALFELEVNNYHLSDEALSDLYQEGRDICEELNLREKFGYRHDHNFPSYHEVNALYHQMKKDGRGGPT